MNIDMVTPRFHPTVGGIEEAVAQLATGLKRRGHEVVIHTTKTGDLATQETWRGLDVRRYEPEMQRGYYVSRFEPKLEGEIVHLHAYAHHTNDWVIERHPNKPTFVSTHHGVDFPKGSFSARAYHAYYNRFIGIPNLRRVTNVLVPTSFDERRFTELGVPRERIHVVPSGVDEAAFSSHEPLTPEGVDPKWGFLLFLGRLHEEKGLDDLLEGFRVAEIRSHLVIAGRDEGMAQACRSRAEEDRRIHVWTDFTQDEKWGLLEACRGLVLPSRHEGQGIVVAEAWAKGKPVVCSRAGALPSVVEDGINGLLAPVGDAGALAAAMRRIVADAPLAKRLGEAGREKAERDYHWDGIVNRVEVLYRGEGTRAERTGTPATTRAA
ncbi:MAG TPA: glycosyltransferase family 4 protein [Candidatus Thermoplasmatota archaeon]|nr:glycosyltransferase family 4 protein [Candidatus Thermoplasmatota archaeon]